MALGTILAIIGAVAAVGGAIATPIASASAAKNAAKQQAAATVEAARVTAGKTGVSAASKAALTESQLLAGNPNILSNANNTTALSGRGRLLGN